MAKRELTPSTFRVLLIISLIVIVALCITVMVFATAKLQTVATDVSHAVADAKASTTNLEKLKIIKDELAKQADTIARTNKIVADSQSYQYQNQIIDDLNNYAKASGVLIKDINFGTEANGSTAAKGSTSSSKPAPNGVKITSLSVALDNPVEYNKVMTFIRLIEQNLTKMQVSSVGLSVDAASKKITSDTLTIEVYIK
ncbi:MAG: hypothetical protein ABIR91_01205 [Candidatus Saccharimonadales bacterium]